MTSSSTDRYTVKLLTAVERNGRLDWLIMVVWLISLITIFATSNGQHSALHSLADYVSNICLVLWLMAYAFRVGQRNPNPTH